MTARARQLAQSNYGRNFGWYVEFEGKVIGELVDPRSEEMFWDSYRVICTDASSEAALRDNSHWNECRFRYRNKVLGEYANGFCGGSQPFIRDQRILMRGLYLLPENWPAESD